MNDGRSPPSEGRAGRPTDGAPAGLRDSATIPNAAQALRDNEKALDEWLASFDEHIRSAGDPLFGRGYELEEKVFDLFQVLGRVTASLRQAMLDTASAIEARQGGNEVPSRSDESAVPNGDSGDAQP